MTSFSSLLSTIGGQPRAPQPGTSKPSTSNSTTSNLTTLNAITSAEPDRQQDGKPKVAAGRFKLTSDQAAAGVKRRPDEPDAGPKAKSIKTEQNGGPNRPAAVRSSRFQLSSKSSTVGQPPSERPAPATSSSSNSVKATQKPAPDSGAPRTPSATASKKGFAGVLEKAKAAQAATKNVNAGGIQHKRTEKLTRKDRERMREEARAQQKPAKKGQLGNTDRSRSGTPSGSGSTRPGGGPNKGHELAYKGTMKKPAEPLNYKGTMRAAGSGGPKPAAKKDLAQDKYGGYASWSDLDDAEDDEGGYDSYESDDMEGGFDELEAEESAALRAAKKEDLEALEEEERLKREKLERKRKLHALNKSASTKKRF